MQKFDFYPVLIKGVPYTQTVRSDFQLIEADEFFQALENTVAIFIENKGTLTSVVNINGIVTIAVGEPGLLLGGDAFMRRDDRLNITFTGAGVDRCVITYDIVKGLTPLTFI